jgi:CopG family nickel-responsive transcriptional regulator
MSDLYRFGVSLEKELIDEFDKLIENKNYSSRSDAIRALINAALAKKQWLCSNEVAGAITMTYDHHKRDLVNKLMEIQHEFQHIIISSQHIHIDIDNCLEIIALKGTAKEAESLASLIKAQVGVKQVALNMSRVHTH